MLGSEIITDILIQKGVKCIFTFPGGTLAPLYDAMCKRGLEIICPRHEQGAGYMALAAARLTGVPQIVMVTSGPGVTNLVTVIADAFFDSTPLIAIAGQVGSSDLKSGRKVRQVGFQHADTVDIMKPITKATFQPLTPSELPEVLEKAFAIATDGRPGPVVIDLPMDVQRNSFDGEYVTENHEFKNLLIPPADKIEKAADWIAKSNQPVILAGQGVILSKAWNELREIAEDRSIPVAMSLLGLGAFPTDSPLALGFIGHTGNQYAGKAVHEADLLLVIGARLDVRQTGTCVDHFVPNGKVIRIDIDSSELQYSRVKSDLDIHADVKVALDQLIKALKKFPKKDTSKWCKKINEWKIEFPLDYIIDGDSLKPQAIIETVNRLTKGEKAIVVSGVGCHQHWTARHFDFQFPDRIWLTSGGHGAMGYDLPTAIGASLANKDYTVICFVGDGSLQMNIQELQTVIDYGTPIKIFVLNNHRLAMVSQFQLMNWSDDPTTGNKSNPDFAAIAKAYGIKSYTLSKAQDVEKIATKALKFKGAALVNCLVDPKEDIIPMLLPGQRMDAMWPYE